VTLPLCALCTATPQVLWGNPHSVSKSGSPLSLTCVPWGRKGTVGAHGGAPNVQLPLALEWERGQGERGNTPVATLPMTQGKSRYILF
jgi:hypothetical protein